MRRRVVLGGISAYNDVQWPPGPSNYVNLIIKRGRMEGFLLIAYVERFAEAQIQLATWATQGRITAPVHMVDGLEHAPDALVSVRASWFPGSIKVHVSNDDVES
jgi:NADPH-dependent curcumin reductase CurA